MAAWLLLREELEFACSDPAREWVGFAARLDCLTPITPVGLYPM